MKNVFLALLLPLFSFSQSFSPQEVSAWESQAKRVTIVEDNWGIPHIYGQKDADAVFGLMYVQCSQNFARVERNYLEMMGRLSEIEGEKRLYDDLQMRLIYDSAAAKQDYHRSPTWFKNLLNAFADGINYYLYKHPETKPVVLQRFEPWFPLMYTDGSIAPTQTGGLTVQDLKNFYEGKENATSFVRPELSFNDFNPNGSNGFAIAPSRTAAKKAILYINPHVTFYFRTEAHLVSEEGLNAYGAVTWGQFFVYQGFNEHCGWMHTSSYADVADVYKEKVEKTINGYQYWVKEKDKREGEWQSVKQKKILLYFKSGKDVGKVSFPGYFTQHGPVMGLSEGKWLALKEHNRSLSALMQSWLRTKANGFAEFKKVMEMRSNNSNNTVFADDKGNIAYWHGNFMPRRNPKYDWTLPVDGTIPDTEWKGLHSLDEIIHLYNPKSGWIQNCNSTPFTASGESSPKKDLYPAYMAPEGQNGRALNAMRLLRKANNITLDKIISIGYNTYLTAFDYLLPPLFDAYKKLPQNVSLMNASPEPLHRILAEPIHCLKTWNRSASDTSVATTLAVEWAFKLAAKVPPAKTPEAATNAVGNFEYMANKISAKETLDALLETIKDLERLYGTWQIAWGDVNRYQRSANNSFSDEKETLPVGLGPGTLGSLPSYISRRYDTKKRFGVSGNSFVAAVEFGKRIKAKTIMTGGESFDPLSKHYTDQAKGYIAGKFKDINFYKEDVLKHTERTYHPGE